MRRTKRLVAISAGLALVAIAAACGDDDDGGGAATSAAPGTTAGGTETTAAPGTTAATATTAAPGTTGSTPGTGTTGGSQPAGETAMTVTVNLNPDAVWEDGSPITVADLECTWRANLNTPGSITTTGYDQISSVDQGDSEKQAVINFTAAYGPYKTLFNPIIKAAAVENCDDVSADFGTEMPISGRALMLDQWSPEQSVMVPNPNYWGDDKAVADQYVFKPYADQDTEIASILAGEADFIYPQFGDTLAAAVNDPNMELGLASGGDYEGLYFQQLEGPFSDDDFRAAFSMSIDRDALFNQIYKPIFDAAGMADAKLLNCGEIVEGPYCPEDNFQNTYDPAAAEQTLTDAGWEKNGDGMWAKDGNVPEIRWMINTGNLRRENTQDYLIPLLAQAGFNVVADNCEAECVFQQRLPTLDYDLGMYISTAPPDPTYLIPIMTCDQIPTEENNFQGQNQKGWCNQEASDKLHESDVTADPDARAELIKDALRLEATDHAMLPLVNYPKSGVWRTDQVGGPIDADLANYMAFHNLHQFEDTNGDGQVVLGAEQWPGCLNPVTECQNSSWFQWTITFPLLPGIWDTTNEQTYQITNLVTEEPVVQVL